MNLPLQICILGIKKRYMYSSKKFSWLHDISSPFSQTFSFIPQCFRYFGAYNAPGVPVVLLVMAAGKGTIPAGTTCHSHREQQAACDPSGSIDCFGDICKRQLRKKSCFQLASIYCNCSCISTGNWCLQSIKLRTQHHL